LRQALGGRWGAGSGSAAVRTAPEPDFAHPALFPSRRALGRPPSPPEKGGEGKECRTYASACGRPRLVSCRRRTSRLRECAAGL